ncbi:MAG TPA: HK97 family phage prohead protease [Niabella sp.]|nr:HK97 family phage prohead protease [Niabella sp.]HQW14285.1 HK97 family phage prohead protease [Niabella sp.]HQX18435.1 HK97 family phage prohead protease [Niabella sp.]HQX40073.1 HK97 family phage prohead protease [Niabella sp.]HRB05962.1 HK97 family phage prohead protease [Niabella sp.]
MKRFTLNDGNKVNSYGFRVRNSGIDLSRFSANPVMLDEHWSSTRAVLGKWTDVQVEGDRLTALSEFDTADNDAARIAGKVDRGYINGASIGVLFNPGDMQMQADGVYELVRCELMEASICAIPANANAIRLYAADATEPMSEDAIKLTMKPITHPEEKYTKPENTDMKKIVLSVAALVALGLDKTITNPADGVDDNTLNTAIGNLKSQLENTEQKLSASQLALKALQDAAMAQKKLSAEKLVNEAVDAGKIDATAKADWLKLATENEALACSTLAALPSKKSLADGVDNPGKPGAEDMTIEKFEKLTEAEQLAFRAENKAAFEKMVHG